MTDTRPTGIKITAIDWSINPVYPTANLPIAARFLSNGNFFNGFSPLYKNRPYIIRTTYLDVTTIERDAPFS